MAKSTMTIKDSNENRDMKWMRRLTKFNQKPLTCFIGPMSKTTQKFVWTEKIDLK
jgi:hypothetical protein